MKLTKNTKLREFIQVLGTEAMRDVIHPNVWVNALFADYKPYNEKETLASASGFKLETDLIYPSWCITDMRFPNELQAVKNKGGITIRVNRNIAGLRNFEKDLHTSEIALDFYEDWDHIIDNNSTIENLIEKVKQILEKEEII